MVIKHGVLPTYSYQLSGSIRSVLFQPSVQESVVLFDQQTCVRYTKGRRREKYSLLVGAGGRGAMESNDDVFKMMYASDHNVYVGACRNLLKVKAYSRTELIVEWGRVEPL